MEPSEDQDLPPGPRVFVMESSPEVITQRQRHRKFMEMAKASSPNGSLCASLRMTTYESIFS
jgi:hypothetical protein